MRVRAKNRWLLRVPNGQKAGATAPVQPGDEDLLKLQLQQYAQETDGYDGDLQSALQEPSPRASSPGLAPEVLAKRKERFDKLQAESAERWASRKRRRRTRGWAGLPADPPGPPRFPSETTIDESKQFLSLDNAMYRALRDHFQRICEDAGFIKKTIAGPEKWQAAKDRLITEDEHLQDIFWNDDTNLEAKALALDVVCTDVTKRMRTLERRMTIAEAKNALGVNPEESRQIRNAFYDTLRADHFTSKLEAGDDHWKELKAQWISGSDLLKAILAPGSADPQHETKVKAVEVLCRDVMKRLRDDQTKRDPTRRRSSTENAGNTPNLDIDDTKATMQASAPALAKAKPAVRTNGISTGISTLASQALASAPVVTSDVSDLQIDPSLLQAANDPSFALNGHQMQQQMSHPHHQISQYAMDPLLNLSGVPNTSHAHQIPRAANIPVYIRPSPQSALHANGPLWLARLRTFSIAELRNLVSNKYPEVVFVGRIDGVEKDRTGQEVSYLIEEDEELEAYLTHVKKAAFVVELEAAE